jgi:L-threonylcarbamoyladenylate synthase
MILDGQAEQSIAAGVRCIRAGELLGLPTETVYGLGADADNAAAISRIFSAKGRPADHPLIVHVPDAASVSHFAATVPDFADRLIKAFWPGPLTLILPRRAGVAAAAAGGQDSIGLRCPSHPVAQALLKACRQSDGSPAQSVVWGIAAPSANKFGRVSPTTAQHVQSEFGSELLILDGGPCAVGIESSIIDCTRSVPVLLRPGAVTREQAQTVCGQKVFLSDEWIPAEAAAPRASGTLASHYAPHAKVRLMDATEMQIAMDMLGAGLRGAGDAAPTIAIYSRSPLKISSKQLLSRRMPQGAVQTAQQLFAVLREFDQQGVKLIWIETPPDDPEWDAVRDRLQRAAAELP